MILGIFAPVCAAQKHLSAAACQRSKPQKRGKVFTWPVFACFRSSDVENKRNFLARSPKIHAKCESRVRASRIQRNSASNTSQIVQSLRRPVAQCAKLPLQEKQRAGRCGTWGVILLARGPASCHGVGYPFKSRFWITAR